MVSPSGNTSGASLVIDAIPEISSAIISPKSSVFVVIPYASISKDSGAIKTGDVVSTTVIV